MLPPKLCNRNDMISSREPPTLAIFTDLSEIFSGKFSGNAMTLEISMPRYCRHHTRAAPARRSTRAHSEAVVPVYRHHRSIRCRDSIFALDRLPQKRHACSRAVDGGSGQSGFRSRGRRNKTPGHRSNLSDATVASARPGRSFRLVESRAACLRVCRGTGITVIVLEKSVPTGIACSRLAIVSASMRPRTAAAGRTC